MRKLIVAAVLTAAGVAGCGPSRADVDRILWDQSQKAGRVVMEALNDEMVDPAATKWGAVWENEAWICGSFDPKNNVGAYVGTKRFVGKKGETVLIDGVSTQFDFDAAWAAHCGRARHLVQAGDPPGPAIDPMTDDIRKAEQAAFDVG